MIDEHAVLAAQQNVRRWMALRNEISKASKALSQLRKEKKALDSDIMQFMKENNVPFFDLNSGKMEVAKKETKQAMSKKWLDQTLDALDVSEGHVATIRRVFTERPVITKECLKLSK